MKNRTISFLFVAICSLLIACANNGTKQTENHDGHDHSATESHEGHDHSAEGSHEGHNHSSEGGKQQSGHNQEQTTEKASSDEIVLTPAQAAEAGVKTERATRGEFAETIKTSGRISSAQGDQSVIVAPSDGTIIFASHPITEGSAVGAGQTIATVSSAAMAEGDNALKIRNAYLTAKSEYERLGKLVGQNIVSARDYENAEAAYLNAKSAYEAIGGSDSSKGVAIKSPMGGYVKSIEATNGQYVSAGEPIATVTRNRRVQLQADLPERLMHKASSVRSANFRLDSGERVFSTTALNGRLVSYGRTADGSRYIPITFEFYNRDGVTGGSYAEVWLVGTTRNNVLTLPLGALTEEQGYYFVYTQLDEECYSKHNVTIGGTDGQRVEIVSGIEEGQMVVTEGVYRVKMAASTGKIPEGHSHNH